MWKNIAKYASFDTERLYLRPLSYEDAKHFHALLADPENVAFILSAQPDYSLALDLLVEDWLKTPLGKWALVDKNSQDLIGLLRFERVNTEKQEAELGYLLKKDYRGRGLMTEALASLVYLSFEQIGLRQLSLVIHLENLASQQVAKRVGFRLKRQFKGSDRQSHKVATFVEYGLKKQEYTIHIDGEEV